MFKPSSTRRETFLLDNSKHMFDSNGKPIALGGKLGSKGRATRQGQFPTAPALDGTKPKITLKTKPQVKRIAFKDFPIV